MRTSRSARALGTTIVFFFPALALVGLAGCASSEPEHRWAGADELDFSEDARDPTERDKDGGFYHFRPREEPRGTADPMDPDRRKNVFSDNPG